MLLAETVWFMVQEIHGHGHGWHPLGSRESPVAKASPEQNHEQKGHIVRQEAPEGPVSWELAHS